MNTLKHLLNASRRHPLTGEYTLTYDEISAVLQHIMKTGCTVLLGGDVLDVQMQHLHLNWYYQPDATISPAQNARKSCEAALQYIQRLADCAQYFYIPVFDNL